MFPLAWASRPSVTLPLPLVFWSCQPTLRVCRKLAVASGRRKNVNRLVVPPAPSGSSTAVISNSAVAGGELLRRNSPARSML
jgi:hypothetical protein